MWFSKQSESKTKECCKKHTADVLEKDIQCEVVMEKIQDDTSIVLLDVRTPEEYRERHLKHAFLVPLDQLSAESLANIGLRSDMVDKEIIVYCRSGIRGATAHDSLRALGYKNVKNMIGGMVEWEDAGYPFIEEGEHITTPEKA